MTTLREVQDLTMGESGWTTPWTLLLNGRGEWFVHADYAIAPARTRECCVKVTRGPDGIEADYSRAPYDWHPAPLWDDPPPSVLLLPCARVIGH
jgi:hypothetical protein